MRPETDSSNRIAAVRRIIRWLTLTCFAMASVAEGQTSQRATVVAVVDRDTRAPVINVNVTADGKIDLGRTDSLGRVRNSVLTAGGHSIGLRRIGYRDTTVTIDVRGDGEVISIAIEAVPTSLTTVKVEDQGVPSHLRDFERRRGSATTGLFLDRVQIDSLKNQSLTQILRARARGAFVVSGPDGGEFVTSARPRPDGGLRPRRSDEALCMSEVFVDGIRVYSQPPVGTSVREGPPPFDLRSINVTQLDAIEFYPSYAATPAEFKNGPATCGVLVITHRTRT